MAARVRSETLFSNAFSVEGMAAMFVASFGARFHTGLRRCFVAAGLGVLLGALPTVAGRVYAQDEEGGGFQPYQENPPPDYVGQQNERVRQACLNAGTCNGSAHQAGGTRTVTVRRVFKTAPDKASIAPLDARIIGVWTAPVGHGRWVWEIDRGGAYKFHSEASDGAPAHAGTFAAHDGGWSLRATSGLPGYTDGGTYVIKAAGVMVASGGLGTATWTRLTAKK